MRRLGVGSRSDVWLGSDGSETAAIKVFREGSGSKSVDTEIEALGRASHRHLMRLEDLAMAPNDMPCLILQRLSRWNLGRVLAVARPSDGEAVTILAPLCLAVAELHRVGVAHGRIQAASVLFDDSGAPVLASFGNAELFGPMPDYPTNSSVSPAQLQREVSVANDLDALTNLCLATLRPDCDTARWLTKSRGRESHTFALQLADQIFRHAPAVPVQFAGPTSGETAALIPLRTAETAGQSQEKETNGNVLREAATDAKTLVSGSTSAARAARFSAITHVPEGLVDSVLEWCSVVAERGAVSGIIRRTKDAVRPVRKPVWIVAGLVAVCVVAAVAMMPLGGGGSSGGGANQAGPAPVASPTPQLFSPAALPAITGDDPLAAAAALLDARKGCVESLSVLCLDSVDQHGSTAMESDVAQLRLMQEGGASDGAQFVGFPMPYDPKAQPHITLVERLGDSALLSIRFGEIDAVDASFSLLLIKREEGWRIRDLTPVVHSPY